MQCYPLGSSYLVGSVTYRYIEFFTFEKFIGLFFFLWGGGGVVLQINNRRDKIF